jgi:hypothetical protein
VAWLPAVERKGNARNQLAPTYGFRCITHEAAEQEQMAAGVRRCREGRAGAHRGASAW